MTDTKAIIDRWIDYATASNKRGHLRHLWTVRDVVVGIAVSGDRIDEARKDLKGMKQSGERDRLIEVLDNAYAKLVP